MVRAFNTLLRGARRPAEHQGRAVPRRDAADDLPRLLRLGHRGHARRTQGRAAAVRRHLAGARGRPPRADGRDQVGRQDGPRQDRRHAAEHEVHARRCWPTRTASTSWPTWCAATSRWTATTCSSTWSGPRRSARPRPSPEQHRDLIVRVAGYSDYFCDLSRRAAGRDHRPHGARGVLSSFSHGRVGRGRKTPVGLRKPINRCSTRYRLQCVTAATKVPPRSRFACPTLHVGEKCVPAATGSAPSRSTSLTMPAASRRSRTGIEVAGRAGQ